MYRAHTPYRCIRASVPAHRCKRLRTTTASYPQSRTASVYTCMCCSIIGGYPLFILVGLVCVRARCVRMTGGHCVGTAKQTKNCLRIRSRVCVFLPTARSWRQYLCTLVSRCGWCHCRCFQMNHPRQPAPLSMVSVCWMSTHPIILFVLPSHHATT